MPGYIGHGADVAGMNTGRRPTTERAQNTRGTRRDDGHNRRCGRTEVEKVELGRIGQDRRHWCGHGVGVPPTHSQTRWTPLYHPPHRRRTLDHQIRGRPHPWTHTGRLTNGTLDYVLLSGKLRNGPTICSGRRFPSALPNHASTGPVGTFILPLIPDSFRRLSIHPEIRFARLQHSLYGL